MASDPSIVSLNVGGTIFTTSINTLTKYPSSMLGVMFGGRFSSFRDEVGRYFIDANGEMFKYILDFLRRNKLSVPHNFDNYEALLSEAEYFQIQPLVERLRHVTNSNIVSLNVGGTMYTVSLPIIDKYPKSNLASLIYGEMEKTCTEQGICFIDGDGEMFKYVLSYLRRDELVLPDDFQEFDLLLLEAEYYQIEPLIENIRQVRHRFDVISLIVGGEIYHTTFKTLQKYPHSSLPRMLTSVDKKGRYIIDGDGEIFQYVLDYLRKGRLVLPTGFKSHDILLRDALSYNISHLVADIRKEMDSMSADSE